jgi:hypothetical protein
VAPDLAASLDRLLATGTPVDPAEADLAEAVCSLVWPNWPPYEGRLDQIELWRLRDLLARTTVSPQVLARLGGAGTGLAAESDIRSSPTSSRPGYRPGAGLPDPREVAMIPAPLPMGRRVPRPP